MKPMEIEENSFAIITKELGQTDIPDENLLVVKRVIHTTADFDYAKNLYFSEDVCEIAIKTLAGGACIVTDTTMAMAGINKNILSELNGEIYCFIKDDDVVDEAKQRGVTRATVAVEKAMKQSKPLIYVVGNAPTALIKLDELIKQKKIEPKVIIAVPVGFVNVVESKELIMKTGVPCIVANGRKGGSNVAASIINALMYQIKR
ncbi:MAG: precorrin-8X methylmutase [Epulopiscium sp. Nuni2H_MBin003]|nr:MAG: precorrin-8X methylmutase [Epulopiscium sp. Nuni2H_MBin003]